MSNRVLVVAPHCDDEVLGTGGTIGKHVDAGDEVHVLVLCGREYNRKHSEDVNAEEWKCLEKAKEILGYKCAWHPTPMLPDGDLDTLSIRDIIDPIEKILKYDYDIVYIPWKDDVHQDHRAVFKACMIAMRPISKRKVKKILAYEVPSTTDQNPYFHSFTPNVYVDIGKYIHKKEEALACYEREKRVAPHPRSRYGVRTYASFRGLQANVNLAEAFMLIRELRD